MEAAIEYLDTLKASTGLTSTGVFTKVLRKASMEVTCTKASMEALMENMEASAEGYEAFTEVSTTIAFMEASIEDVEDMESSMEDSMEAIEAVEASIQEMEDTKASTKVTFTGASTKASMDVNSTKGSMASFRGSNGSFRERYAIIHGSDFTEDFMEAYVATSMEDMVRVGVTVTAKHIVRLRQWKLAWKLSRNPPWKLFLWKLLPWKHARKFP